ncbi:hypothetical protein F5Y19DRAFT_481993 [Xylariaceae sp. FL1651]|nr:hypothetical protein F5Y19DRAFT_481993 [Xylariaceae sp. FL1651]
MSSSGQDDEPSPGRPAGSLVGASATTANTQRIKKKRVRNFTEDDRAAHRIFEKSRREAFKEALTNLASLLPVLAETEPQRLSKHVVVDESIAFIRSQQDQIRAATEHLQAVTRERDQLLAELNQWRGGAGIELRQAGTASQAAVHRVESSVTSDAMVRAMPTAQQPADPPLPIVAEATTSFVTSPLHGSNTTPLPTDSNAEMSWEGYPSQIHVYGTNPNHAQGDDGPRDIRVPDLTRMPTCPTPQSPETPRFEVDRGRHDTVFLPYEPQQTYNAGGFQSSTFMQNAVPLQNYMPP